MIFGDPYRFAIWVEYIPQWSDSHKNGIFCFFVNGSMYPDDVRTSTLCVDLYDVIDKNNALVSRPYNDEVFSASKSEAFNTLFQLAYPESTDENEYPDQIFDYCASPTIINDSGAYFFAISNESSVRIIGGKIMQLVELDNGGNTWENIGSPLIEDVIITKNEINEIITKLKGYSTSLPCP